RGAYLMNLSIQLPGLNLKNPIMPASGCFGFGREYSQFFDLNELGAIIMKSATGEERLGNATPRVAETASGMLNAIGLQNPGVNKIIKTEIPFLKQYNIPIIANVAGSTIEEYVYVAEAFSKDNNIDAIELNISCPNVKEGGIQFGTNDLMAEEITKRVKAVSNVPVYIKLSPNVTNVVEIAKAVERAGADGLTMINTLTGMQIHLPSKRPLIANRRGGLSGPAIKPISIRMIYEVSEVVNIPIIGTGGITSAEDVIEYLLAGASAVAVGTANFSNPLVCSEIIQELPQTLKKYGFNSIKEVIGKGHA